MPTKYCPHCAASNSYSVNPPTKCEKCKESFASAFREVTAAKPARIVRTIYVDEDGNEVDAPQEEVVVRRTVKASRPLPKKSGVLDQLMRKKRMGDTAEETETEDETDAAELPAENDEGLSETYSAEELAAALDPDDLIRETVDKDDAHVKFGQLVGKPISDTESPFGRRLIY